MYEYQQAGLSDPHPNTCSSLCILEEAMRQGFLKTPTIHKSIQYDMLLPVAFAPEKIIPHTFSCDVIYVASVFTNREIMLLKGKIIPRHN